MNLDQLYQNLIANYRRWKMANPDTWVVHAANQENLLNAITVAATSRDQNGKKHPHQYRLQNITLERFANSIHTYENELRQATDFDTILATIEQSKIYGIGELTVYDTAVRIGAYLDIWPERIYLHAGAKIGASGLIPNLSSNVIDKNQLPAAFRNSDLTGYDLEDMMCIYKSVFNRPRI